MGIESIAPNIVHYKLRPSILRQLVDDGFTIENRRSLQGLIGREEMQRLGDAFVDLSKNKNYEFFTPKKHGLEGKVALFKLIVGSGQHELTYTSVLNGLNVRRIEHKLVNDQISLENILETLKNYKAKHFDAAIGRKAPTLRTLEESQTIKMLYSPKYKVSQGLNEDGYYMTSIIDNTTKEPVTAYVKRAQKAGNDECWEIYIKNSNGNYEEIGNKYVIMSNLGNIYPAVYAMTSEKSERYLGVGVRLHQIAIERMLQSKGNQMSLISCDTAFPFHYKCGFRVNPEHDKKLSLEEYNKILNEYETKLGLKRETIEKVLIKRKFNGVEGYGKEETYQELAKFMFLENRGRTGLYAINMELTPEALAVWKERIKAQPILQESY